MSTSCITPVAPHVQSTLGALLVGNLAADILYGFTTLQTYTYCKRSHKDSMALKGSVFLLWMIDTAHLVLINHGLYFYLIMDFGSPFALIESETWYIPAIVFVSASSDLVVRCIFGRRIWILSEKNIPLTAAVHVLTLLTTASVLTFAIRSLYIKNEITQFTGISKTMLCLGLGASIISDAAISISLCTLLRRNHSSFRETASLINILVVYTINTGLLTGITAALCLITFLTMPDNCIFLAIYFTLNKLLLNSLLAELNARKRLRGLEAAVDTGRRWYLLSPIRRFTNHNPVTIAIETVVDMAESDEGDKYFPSSSA